MKKEVVTRRSLLAGGASAAAILAVSNEASAQAKKPAPAKPAPAKPAPPKPEPAKAEPVKPVAPVNFGVIGLGLQGREILASLARVPGANVVAICDKYEPFLKRGQESAPKGEPIGEYKKLLERSDVQAVVIATPTHQHKEIALAALQAGKAVYCEAPLAHTIEEAREIARAARDSKQIFQVGLQNRANEQHHHVEKFVRTGALAKIVAGRGHWHKKTSWRRSAPSDERQREINWRLQEDISLGLIGEVGIHSLDVATWFLKGQPVSVSGFGAVLHYTEDGRKVPDTVQCVLEYPGGVRFAYDITLANSFDGQADIFMGVDSAVLMRDQRAWMFKEADSPLLGWEVYARKEEIGDETGIALVADATKQLKEGKIPGKQKVVLDPGKTALYFALESFANCIREKKTPDCGPVEGFQSVVTVAKANEAILKGTKVVYQKDWFEL